MTLFDTHCHFDYPPLCDGVSDLIDQCLSLGISRWLVPATTYERFPHICQFVAEHKSMHLALGLHPVYLAEHLPQHIEALDDWVMRYRPVAIGEIGLDYFVETLDRDAQQHLFEAQIHCAMRHQLPLILHVRRSHDAVIQTLKRCQFQLGGIVHAFAGSREQANEFIKLGFCLGFGGVMTYEGSKRVRRLATELPLSAIVLETDAPDMRPADWSLEHNLPTSLSMGFKALCSLRAEDAEQLAAQTTQNAIRVLGLV